MEKMLSTNTHIPKEPECSHPHFVCNLTPTCTLLFLPLGSLYPDLGHQLLDSTLSYCILGSFMSLTFNPLKSHTIDMEI